MDEMLEIEELRARNKILEEIHEICTDCRAGSMIAPPCEDMKKEIKQLKDELSQLQQLKDEDSLRVVQLVSELEQEKALKDTYFALYNTKHEDLAKEYYQLKAYIEKAKQTNLDAGQELIRLSKENADLKSELETAKINYADEVDLQKVYRQELDEIAHFIGLPRFTGETIMHRLKLHNKCSKARFMCEDIYSLTLDKIKEIAAKTYNTKLAEKDCVNCDDSFAQILQEINKSKEKVESIYKRLSEQAFTKEELEDE